MKRALIAVVLVALAGCSSADSDPGAGSSGTVAVPTSTQSAAPSSVTTTPEATAASPSRAQETSQPAPAASATGSGDATFCDYLASTVAAQQQIEDPAQLVELVQGAQAVAPGAIAEDVALYAQSVKKLALTVTGSPEQAAAADAWLTRNDAAVTQAQTNINSYSESVCGVPFLAGEG